MWSFIPWLSPEQTFRTIAIPCLWYGAGRSWGGVLPIVALAVARLLGARLWYLFQFFAGFCLIVNGVYLGVGLFEGVGDAGDLLRYGSPHWTLIIFGLVCTPLGLWLWNGLGLHFGLGNSNGRVNPIAVRWSLTLFLIIVMVEVFFTRWS